MKKLNLREIHLRELNILMELDEFCKENHLRYYLSGGTLLGAIRHKGFIPWDDDIDVCMPRPDYMYLLENFKCSSTLEVRSNLLNNWDAPFAKIIDYNTEVHSLYSLSEKNLWIDIFPVDGLPENVDKVAKIYKRCEFYRKLFMICNARMGKGKTYFHRVAKSLIKPVVVLYGKGNIVKKIEKIAQSYPYKDCKYVGAITWGLYGVGERMLKSEFEKQTMVEFEGHHFPAFSCWDSYLRGLYGDYMKLPPIEKRQTHDMEVYVKE
jgi:lipopolysaccharide cholinephosphotransferase